MSKKKVLIIAEELSPYTFENDIANLVGKLPQAIHESGMEVRILMPKFGIINERRHRLHEVVRLSGMNIIIDDDDIDADTFETFGTLVAFAKAKLGE